MRNTAHLHILIGLVLLFTLMAGAGATVQARGVVLSHAGPTLTQVQRHPDASEHPAGTVTTSRSCTLPQFLRPQLARCLPGRTASSFAMLTLAADRFPARPLPATRQGLLLYALHPRPPTAPHFA